MEVDEVILVHTFIRSYNYNISKQSSNTSNIYTPIVSEYSKNLKLHQRSLSSEGRLDVRHSRLTLVD